MRTLVLQALVSLLYGFFGIASLSAARSLPASEGTNRLAWRAAGVGYLLFGLSCMLQSGWAFIAYFSGPGTAAYSGYLAMAPVLNHGRTFLVFGLAAGLAVAFVWALPDDRRSLGTLVSLCAVGLTLGGLVGAWEGTLVEYTHYRSVALFDVAELLVLLVAMFAGLVTERMDRLLFGALAVYAFGAALNILWMIALSALGGGGWTPAAWTMHAYRVVLIAAMALFGMRRAQLASRGESVPSLGGARQRVRVSIGSH